MTFVIIGNGIAGFTAATTIRDIDKESEIILIGDEANLTYSRPMISKAPLLGFDTSKFILKDKSWYQENNITTIVNTKVVDICKDLKTITLDNQETIKYDKCIIATGAESFIPPIKGHEKKGVFVARKISDIADIRRHQLKSKNAVVIGGGVIGLEIAWELKKAGLNVVVLEVASNLMGRLLDDDSAKKLKDIVISQGIDVVNDVNIDEIFGSDKVEKVILKDKTEYEADLVVLSCGIKPNIEIAKRAGVNTERSIIVNSKMETNIDDIYACGDCAEYNKINLALWEQSVRQGEIAGKNACGQEAEYEQISTNLIFNGINTSLYTIGDIGKNTELDYKEILRESKNKKSQYFSVNKLNNLDYSYEKYYFANDVIVGGVLIGDLTKINDLKKSIEDKVLYEDFKNLLD